MDKLPKKIRPIALLLIENDGKLLVFKARDGVKNQEFYRMIGGGIEYGETGEQALIREVKEEISAELINIELIKIFENIFTYEGESGHELVFIYKADFKDAAFYKKNNIPIIDCKAGRLANWVEIKVLKKSNFYPEGIEDLV